MICSHLNPSSVMHLYAKDLDDLPSLVTSRGSGLHVHICADAQTGLVTNTHQDRTAQTLALLQLFHIVSKTRRIFESSIRMTVPLTSTLATTRETRTTTD